MMVAISDGKFMQERLRLAKAGSQRSCQKLGTIGRGRSRHRPRDDESLYGGAYPFDPDWRHQSSRYVSDKLQSDIQ